jgi:hypothetical protein
MGPEHALQRNRDAVPDLSSSGRHDLGGEEVECPQNVLLAIFVEDSPGASLGLSLNPGQVIKVGN